jgi:hypothetical protein
MSQILPPLSLRRSCVSALFAGALAVPALAQPIRLQQTGAPFNNPIGVAYHPGNSSLIVTNNYPSGNPNSFSRIDQFGNTTPWSSASGLANERYLDIPRQVNTSSFWTPGETFSGNGTPGQIMRISADGSTVTNSWVTLPGEFGLLSGQIRFDNTGLFNNDMIVTTTSGNVWKVKSSGITQLLATLPTPGNYEGLAVVPVNPTRYGPLSGRIIVGDEYSNTVWTVDTVGNMSILPGIAPNQVEGLHVIPANEHFVGVDYIGGQILFADQSYFTPYVGDLLVVCEVIGANPGNPSGLNRLLWNNVGAGSFTIAPIPLTNDSVIPTLWEGSTFAPIVVPAPGTLALLASAGLLLARRRR